jgi:hypothetical protein
MSRTASAGGFPAASGRDPLLQKVGPSNVDSLLQVHGSGERSGLWGMRKEAEEGQKSGGERERSRDREAPGRTSALRPRTARQAVEGGVSGSKGQIRPRSARAAHGGKENDASTTSLNSLPASQNARPRAGAAEQSNSRTTSVLSSCRTTETPRPSRYASSRYKTAEQGGVHGVNLPGRSTRGTSVGDGEAPTAPLPVARAAPRHLASPRATTSRTLGDATTRHHRDSSSRVETTAGSATRGPALEDAAPTRAIAFDGKGHRRGDGHGRAPTFRVLTVGRWWKYYASPTRPL